MKYDLEDLTLGEVETIEELTNMGITEIGENPTAKVMRAIAFVITRRDNPNYNYEDTATISLKDFTEDLQGKGESVNWQGA